MFLGKSTNFMFDKLFLFNSSWLVASSRNGRILRLSNLIIQLFAAALLLFHCSPRTFCWRNNIKCNRWLKSQFSIFSKQSFTFLDYNGLTFLQPTNRWTYFNFFCLLDFFLFKPLSRILSSLKNSSSSLMFHNSSNLWPLPFLCWNTLSIHGFSCSQSAISSSKPVKLSNKQQFKLSFISHTSSSNFDTNR